MTAEVPERGAPDAHMPAQDAHVPAQDASGPVPGTPALTPEVAADGEWLRVHPASPFVRGWVALAAIGIFFGRDIFERLLQGRPLIEEDFAGRAPWLAKDRTPLPQPTSITVSPGSISSASAMVRLVCVG